MNDVSDKGHVPKKPSKVFWWSLVILFVTLPVLLLCSAKFTTSGSMTTKTQVIINSIRTSLQLTEGRKRAMIPLDYAYLRKEFDSLDTIADLRALRAIDDTRQSFVDAWGRPLVIRLGPNQQFEVISSGPDGLPGTSDDLR